MSEDGKARVSHAWALIFNPKVEPEITTDPAEIRKFFSGLS